jgi:hypothetical protein
MRMLKLACGAIMLVAILAAVAPAQAPVPTVGVTASGSAITLTPAGQLAAGPTRFQFTRSGRRDVEAFLVTLRAGVTVDQFRAALSRNPDAALGLVFLEGGASLSGPTTSRAVTIDLRPGVTYHAVTFAGRANAVTSFTTGAASGARAPSPDATIRMVDYGFRGPSRLPRDGRIRVTNDGAAFHFALAFAVRQNVSARRVRRALRGGGDRAIERVVAGPPFEVQSLISPGTINDNEIRFARRGRYAFVCFFGAHNRLGMYRIFNVR